MNIFFNDHILVLKAMESKNVRFLLIGEYAVIHYGYRRTTGDMDIWLEPSNENKIKFIHVLESLNFDAESIQNIQSLDFTKQIAFTIGEEPQQVDFMTFVNMVKFDEAYNNKNIFELDGVNLPLVHLNDLVLMKLNTGRIQDKADVEELQRIQNSRH